MNPATKILQVLRISVLASIVFFALVAEGVAGKITGAWTAGFYWAISLVALLLIAAVVAVRRWFVSKAEAALAAQPTDAAALTRWCAGYIVTYALCETVALFGLVLRVNGFTFSRVAYFYVVGFALILFFGPQRPSNQIS